MAGKLPSPLVLHTPQENVSSSFEQRLQRLEDEHLILKKKYNEIIEYNTKLSNMVTKLSTEKDELFDELEEHKIELTALNQYGRRESIEIANVPESIPQHKLEEYVVKFLNVINVKVQHYDIVAVHRLGKKSHKPRNVIVRFLNRKHAFSALKNKRLIVSKKLVEYKNLFIFENLCPYNKKIFDKLYKMKKVKQIHGVWSYNGNVFMQISNNGEQYHIQHLSDIDYYLYDEDMDFPEEQSAVVDVADNSTPTSNNLNSNDMSTTFTI